MLEFFYFSPLQQGGRHIGRQFRIKKKEKEMKLMILLLCVISACFTGCSAIQLEVEGTEDYKKIMDFKSEPGMATLYVYRDNNSDFGFARLSFAINGYDVYLDPACVVRVELEPNTYHLEADHLDVWGFEDEIDITLQAGEIRYLEFKSVFRRIGPGSSRLINRTATGAQEKIKNQNLCVQKIISEFQPQPLTWK